MPWKKLGNPGSVTVMEGAGPELRSPSPADPLCRDSGLPSTCMTMDAVLVVWEDVCPEVLAEERGGDMDEESDKEEVERDD